MKKGASLVAQTVKNLSALQARILEWVAILPPGELPNPGIEPKSLMSPALQVGSWEEPPGKPQFH